MTKGTHLLRSALLALLALAVISGGSLAAGDLFDDDYSDCPHRTRLRDGQISDLSVNRDSEEEDEVNVSWAATDPATWGLGPNAYSTSLVVILDDGTTVQTEDMALGARKTTFDTVATGTEVTVQMAIVVDTPDGDYLISDILEQSINQSLTEPSFSTGWLRVAALAEDDDDTTDADETAAAQFRAVAGEMYYVGYNEQFANYRANGLRSVPGTPRLRIGLANTELDDDGDRYASDAGPYDDVDFEAYIIRIVDEDGDVVSAGDDVFTFTSAYSTNKLVVGTAGIAEDAALTTTFTAEVYSVRINDDGDISEPLTNLNPSGVTLVADATAGAAVITGAVNNGTVALTQVRPAAIVTADGATFAGEIFAEPPNEHRDFPLDTFTTDEKFTITAWAINEDDEVISPVASLTVRPIDQAIAQAAPDTPIDLDNYRDNGAADSDEEGPNESNVYVTQFTVIK